MMRSIAPAGTLTNKVKRASGPGIAWKLRNNLRWGFIKGWLAATLAMGMAHAFGLMTVTAELHLKVRRASGEWVDYGCVSRRVVTTVGATAMANSFITPASPGNFFYHGLGTGSGAEAAGNTALVTEITTQYATDNTRPAGTHVAGASAWIYSTVATNTVDGAVAAIEHGVFSAASAGSLLDRSVFSVINLASGDSLVSTYQLTFTAGS